MKNKLQMIAMIVCASSAALAGAQVYGVGDGINAYSINNQGVAVGFDAVSYYLWSNTTGTNSIGGGGENSGAVVATISGDGSIVGGTTINPVTGFSEAATYNVASKTWTTLGSLGSSSGGSASSEWGMSADGNIVVGNAWVSAGSADGAVFQNGTVKDLGTNFPGNGGPASSTRVDGVSNDGSLMGGYQDQVDGTRAAAIWLNGYQSTLSYGGNFLGEVEAVSGNGQYAVGGGGYAVNGSAYVWNRTNGVTLLDNPFASQGLSMTADAISADGSFIVGFAGDFFSGNTGWIWSQKTGTMLLSDYVASLGFNSQGFNFNTPLGVSADGRNIVGFDPTASGFGANGWAITNAVPEPGELLALTAGVSILLIRRKK